MITEEMKDKIAKMWLDGISGGKIAEALDITRNSVMGLVHRLKLVRSEKKIIKPIINIYTRSSINDSWQLVTEDQIKDIDCENGVVYFHNSIVPVITYSDTIDSSLIKIDYTYKSNYAMIRQINGDLIPLNP